MYDACKEMSKVTKYANYVTIDFSNLPCIWQKVETIIVLANNLYRVKPVLRGHILDKEKVAL